MEDLPLDKPAEATENPQRTNWCCLMGNLSTVQGSAGDGPMSCQPTKLFEWLSAKNLPQLEDETPPSSFYEVLESAEIAFHCSQCDKLLLSLNAETLQRTIGTQTQMLQLIQAQTQTPTQPRNRTPNPNPTEVFKDPSTTPDSTPLRLNYPHSELRVDRTFIEDLWQFRQRSLWSLIKTVLLCISILNGCYLVCRGICRLSVLRRILPFGVGTAVAPPPPPPPPPPATLTNSLPKFLWSQLCRLARKLHII